MEEISLEELCGTYSNLNETSVANFKLYGQGITVSIVGLFGLIGNTLAILTIASMRNVTLFYKLLVALAIFDVLFILTGGLFIVQTAFKFEFPWYNLLFPSIIYPVAGISMTGSTYSCLAIAAERYLGICHPNRNPCYRKFRFYVIGIFLACLAIDLPRFFEVQSIMEDGEAVGVEYSPLRTNGTFILAYVMWYRLLTTIALPFALMLFFNIKVFSYYKQNNLQSHSSQEKTLLTIFCCINSTFFICHLPRVVLNIYEFFLHQRSHYCQSTFDVPFVPPPWMFIMTSIEKVLLIINASANFIYYCFSGREFRNRFCRIVCCDFTNLFRRCRYVDSPGVVGGGTFHTVVMAYTPNDRRESSIDSQTVFMDVAGFKSDFEMTTLA
ncbi:hypothetical protein TCAL_15614, partial [Tigriopus californicus]